ncbi:MAG: F420-dependent NADP oxidoreductase [Bacteroides sp.]|nr:F420-dependent NADP oxidoreductase [Roseburia sp.]MCM1347408.1 F420-dependent NADP oxidoreductase [Bacteroides sp.]MCM1421879.1 F420-dependent NADP oxidoreductase [Bacteroides sp.]
MDIVLVGAGNLATNLGRALRDAGHTIKQVYSRTEESAAVLAGLLRCGYTTVADDVGQEADVYIFSVKDSVLKELADKLRPGREEALFVHTAGSMDMGVLGGCRRGVLYPMQTFSKQKPVDFRHIPCFVEASDETDSTTLKALAESVSERVYELSGEDRKYLHLAAVFCCNFANHCYAIGADILKRHGIPFDVMLPLIQETADKLRSLSPREAQTGPAVRYDTNVMDRQKALLADLPDFRDVYDLMSEGIHKNVNK